MARWLRFVLVALRAHWREPLQPTDTATVTAIVWPADADLSFANNASYLVFFEMARVDLQVRSGFARQALRKGWSAPMASINVQFRKPLRRFQRVRVSARIAYWNDKWLYIEQRMERHGELIASALAKSLVVGKGGRIAPVDLAAELGLTLTRSSEPPMIARFEEAETLMRERAELWKL